MNSKSIIPTIILLILSAIIAIWITPHIQKNYAEITDNNKTIVKDITIYNKNNLSLDNNINLKKDDIFFNKRLAIFNEQLESLKLERIKLEFRINKELNGLGDSNMKGCGVICQNLKDKLLSVNNLIFQYENIILEEKKTFANR